MVDQKANIIIAFSSVFLASLLVFTVQFILIRLGG